MGRSRNCGNTGFEDARKPEQSEIDAALALVDYERVVLDDAARTVQLADAAMRLDLGAIAKGYITDEVKDLLAENGVTTAIIDLGGNVYVMGGSPLREGESWNVGIQDPDGCAWGNDRQDETKKPFDRDFRHLRTLYRSGGCQLSPSDGSGKRAIRSITISPVFLFLSDKSIDGDALSTLVFGLGLEAGLAYVNERDDIEAVFVTKDKKVYVSDGLIDNFELTNDDYVWENE